MSTRIQTKNLSTRIAGFGGLFGLFGFRYFFTGNPADLWIFTLFGLFGFFFLSKINNELQDERWKDNSRKAYSIAFGVAVSFIFLIGFFFTNFDLPKDFVAGGTALGWSASLLTYAIAFWSYERA